jgi:hypothetical protein
VKVDVVRRKTETHHRAARPRAPQLQQLFQLVEDKGRMAERPDGPAHVLPRPQDGVKNNHALAKSL